MKLKGIVLGLIFFFSPSFVYAQIPSFPGAAGFGTNTPGGRGGKIYAVTNLNDTGPGSFREGLNLNEPRIIIFKVGGVINTKSEIKITNPYLTVAGQTAPGKGIVLSGSKLTVQTHDVIIRGLRIRIGDAVENNTTDKDGFGALSSASLGVNNIVFDHNSISWATDENISTWDGSSSHDQVKNITFSWNIVSEGLYCSIHSEEPTTCQTSPAKYPHSMGFLIGDYSQNVSAHHNLFASNYGRNPLIQGGTTSEFVNNLVYNWGDVPTQVSDSNQSGQKILANILGNYYIPTNGTKIREGAKKGIYLRCSLPTGSKVYVEGNIGPGREEGVGDEWEAVTFQSGCDLTWAKSTDNTLPTLSGLRAGSAKDSYLNVLDQAGALLPQRDEIDSRVIQSVKQRTEPMKGKWFIDSPDEVEGYDIYPTVADARPDIDNDYLPDEWEKLQGKDLDPLTTAPSGYTWIEEYINSYFNSTPSITPPSITATVTIPPPSATPTVCATRKIGDANCDQKIDLSDFNLWVCEFVHQGECSKLQSLFQADFGLFDHRIDINDFEIWRRHQQ